MSPLSRDPLSRYLARPGRRRLAAVVRAHYEDVWKLALRLTGNEEDASDLAQDVFLSLLLDPPAPHSVRSPGGFLAWRTVDRNSRRRRALRRQREREEEHARRLAARVESSAEMAIDDLDLLRASLDLLPDEEREPLELRHLAGRSTAEIASILGIGERAVRLRLERARGRLASRLSPLLGGALMAGGGLLGGAPSPPAGLLPRLLAALEVGEAVAVTTAATSAPLAAGTSVGALLMSTQKAVIAALVISVATIWIAWSVLDPLAPSPTDSSPSTTSPEVARDPGSRETGSRADVSTPGESPSSGEVVDRSKDVSASIRGRVHDPDGNGILGARLWAIEETRWEESLGESFELALDALWRDPHRARELLEESFRGLLEDAGETRSGPGGNYAFGHLAPGEYRIIVLARGHRARSPEVISFTGELLAHDIELEPAVSISGQVVDAAGQPIEGSSLRWRPSSRRNETRNSMLQELRESWERGSLVFLQDQVTSDARGHFELSSLEPGPHDIVASAPGHPPRAVFDVPTGTADLVLTLEAGLTVTGSLVDGDDQPVAGARITIESDSSREVHRVFDRDVDTDPLLEVSSVSAESDAAGRFELEGLTEGWWSLDVLPLRGAPHRQELRLVDAPVDLGRIVIRDSLVLEGRVLDPRGKPVNGANIRAGEPRNTIRMSNSIQRELPVARFTTTTNPEGRFRLEGLPPGKLDLIADHEAHALRLLSGVTPGTGDLVIVLETGTTIRGRVLREDTDEPVAGARVSTGFGHWIETISDEDGAFTLRGISHEDTHRGKAYLDVKHDDLDSHRQSITLITHDESQQIVIRLKRSDRIEGRVTDLEGLPLSGARVRLAWHDEGGAARGIPLAGDTTDDEGHYSLPAPAQIRYTIGNPRIRVEARSTGFAPRHEVVPSIPPTGQPWPRIDLVLEKPISLEGSVHGEEGEPVAGAWIEAFEPVPGARRIVRATTDARGEFRLTGLPAGSIVLDARAPGRAPGRVEVHVERDDASESVSIVLTRGASLRGSVVDVTGVAMGGVEVVALANREATGEEASPETFHDRMQLRRVQGLARTITDADGAFELADLDPRGVFDLVARARGHEVAIAREVRPDDSIPPLVLRRFSAIVGQVVDRQTRAPVPSFKINLIDLEARTRLQKKLKMSDPRLGSRGELTIHHPAGRFFYDGLNPGPHEINVTSDDHVFHTSEIKLEPGEEREILIELDAGGELIIHVVDHDSGAPIENALVSANSQAPGRIFLGSRRDITTDRQGRCRVPGLEDGKYFVMAGHPLWRRNPDCPCTFEVHAGEVTEATVSLLPAGRLRAHLEGLAHTGEDGHTVNHRLEAALLPEGEGEGGREDEKKRRPPRPVTIYIDHEGRLTRDQLEPGRYRLTLVSQAMQHGELAETGPTTGFSSLDPVGPERRRELGEIEIVAGETTSLERRFHDGAPDSQR